MKEHDATRSILNIYKVSGWLAITPFQEKDNDSFVQEVFERYYSMLCCVVFSTLMIMAAVIKISFILKNMIDTTISVIILLTYLSNCLLLLITLLTVAINRQSWRDFFDKLQILEQKVYAQEKKFLLPLHL